MQNLKAFYLIVMCLQSLDIKHNVFQFRNLRVIKFMKIYNFTLSFSLSKSIIYHIYKLTLITFIAAFCHDSHDYSI